MPAQEFFTPVSFDFLWEAAGLGDLPYPLRVGSHGETEVERAALRERANVEFAARELRNSPVEDWLGLLSRPRISIDALHIPDFRVPPVAALAASDGNQAVLAVQNSDGIWLRPIYPDGLVSAVVDLLPACGRGSEASVTLPIAQALRTRPANTGVPAAAGASSRRAAGLAERTANEGEAYARLISQPRLRGGQLAANSRDELGGRRRSGVLAWFDTASGRYLSLSRTGPDGTEWVTVAPADAKALRGRLAELVTEVTR
ncbi:hypothetical protein SacmaDRAFT_4986 [Saccharomonospora marina XMU15]|uniref:EspG family n=1 Tax=Saccharomonospora marina XMU15 TaxID=882083 RepID=H5X227_9PSEU|nr:ESX secretion-associated protein EspG [Saccharomonospora marina]EHR53156.1 hypothetical protein SacmaDRAFT_4986 [Saccharomonospora marina XMU15]